MAREKQISPKKIRHYSDANMMIRQVETGIIYQGAVDNIPRLYIYEETDKPITRILRRRRQGI